MEVLKIPTAREGTILKQVTDLDHKAWLLTNRRFSHPSPPDHPAAPDHQAFKKIKKFWESRADQSLDMGIWDLKSFERVAFIGYVTLAPTTEYNIAEVGVEIAELYRRRGYGSLAIQAIVKYGRSELGYKVIEADILSANRGSRGMIEKLGFELSRESRGHAIYHQSQSQP